MSDREQVFPRDAGGVSPVVFIGPFIVAALIFVLARRSSKSTASRAADKVRDRAQDVSRKGGSASRRALLTFIINAIENDGTRRVILIALKFARDRV